jgi:hypothetical protein
VHVHSEQARYAAVLEMFFQHGLVFSLTAFWVPARAIQHTAQYAWMPEFFQVPVGPLAPVMPVTPVAPVAQ